MLIVATRMLIYAFLAYVPPLVVSMVIALYTINRIVRKLAARFLIEKRELKGKDDLSYLLPQVEDWSYILARYIGWLEMIIYIASYLSSHIEIIGVWLLMKTAGEWQSGTKSVESRPYSIFLIGSALSLILSISTAVFIQNLWIPIILRQSIGCTTNHCLGI